jgi:hypothetical protein
MAPPKSEKEKGAGEPRETEPMWRRYSAEQLEQALAGIHSDVMKRLMAQLEDLRSARALVDFIAAQDWESVDADTRAIALFEINRAITALGERQKLPPINDALQGEPLTAFQIIREIINQFPAHAGRPAGVSGKQWSEENVERNDDSHEEDRP